MEYCKTERGKDMLIYDGYLYIQEKVTVDKTIWKCREWYKQRCRGRVHVSENRIFKSVSHNHVPDAGKVAVAKAVSKLKQKTSTTHLATKILAADTFAEIPEAAVGQAPALKNLKRTIQRCRNQVSGHPPNPRNVCELVLAEPYTSTKDGQRFLLYDSGMLSSNRIIIFGTTKSLDMLVSSPHWFADGTFKTVPPIFSQLYTLHAIKYKQVFPAVYVLMTDRTEESYSRFLRELKTMQPGLNPSTVMIDFERAAMAAFAKEFQNTAQKGCFFHLTQCLWRKVQEHGLQCKYMEDAEFAVQVRMLSSIAFVPEDQVVTVFEELTESAYYQQNEDDLQPLKNYFEDVWIGRPNRRGSRQRPKFAHNMWNVSESVRNDLPKTNNSVEGWHTSFSSLIGAQHVAIFPFIEALKRDETLTRCRVQELECGEQPNPQKKCYRDTAARIKEIVMGYDGRGTLEYLRAVARNFQLQI